MGEVAVLSTIAAEVAGRELCRLTIGHIAAPAGVSRSTVKTAVRQAVVLGVLTPKEWRLTAWRSAPTTVRIVSAEWRAWLKMRDRKRAGGDHRDRPRITFEGVGSELRPGYGMQILLRREASDELHPPCTAKGRGARWSI